MLNPDTIRARYFFFHYQLFVFHNVARYKLQVISFCYIINFNETIKG